AGLYPPASTFKIVIALAALEKGIIKPEATLANEDGRQIDMIEALARSSNLFFFKLGRVLGVDGISYFARQLGLGALSGIDLPYERKGLVPDKGWKERWPRGEIDNLSIGQGALQVTPLQMANLIAAVAQGGKIYRPRLVQKIVSPEGEVIKYFPVQLKRKLPLSPANLDVIKRGLESAVLRGTGRRARVEAVEVAGKTGTAEVTSRRFHPGEERPHELRSHAWFISFAPRENPTIALAVLVEHGGWGGVAAASLTREVMEAFFSQKDINHRISPN
ncbi:penicillin-binding protein 2, partial [candidate division NPL-UPA2 bacterium]|nr:penicillin-binding protein 2 [candidate division NPL-UPA2 bacterium]